MLFQCVSKRKAPQELYSNMPKDTWIYVFFGGIIRPSLCSFFVFGWGFPSYPYIEKLCHKILGFVRFLEQKASPLHRQPFLRTTSDRRLCSWKQAKCLGQFPRPIQPQSSLEFHGLSCGKKCQIRWPYHRNGRFTYMKFVWYFWFQVNYASHGSYGGRDSLKFHEFDNTYWSIVENGWVTSEICFKFGWFFLIRFPPKKNWFQNRQV